MPEPNISPLSVLFILGFAQAIFLALAIVANAKGNRKANRYLAGMLVVFGVDLLNEFLDISLYGLQVLEVMFFTFPTDLLYGPLIWMYVRQVTGRDLRIRGIAAIWHFLPFAAHAAVILSKLPMAHAPDLLTRYPQLLEGNQIQPWIMHKGFAIAAVFQIAAYLYFSIRELRRHRVRIGDQFSYEEGVGLKWLRSLLSILLILYLLFVTRFVIAQGLGVEIQADIILNIGMVTVIYLLGYFGIRQPQIFNRLRAPEIAADAAVDSDATTTSPSDEPPAGQQQASTSREKYHRSSMDRATSAALFEELGTLMSTSTPYLDNELNLPQLADLVGVSSNHLSQAINEHAGLNFFDFVNQYRINDARQALIERDPKQYTILGLALDCGFNSKSAFYSSFKKQTGQTPTEFRRQHLKAA